jgi:hypothetical protein
MKGEHHCFSMWSEMWPLASSSLKKKKKKKKKPITTPHKWESTVPNITDINNFLYLNFNGLFA